MVLIRNSLQAAPSRADAGGTRSAQGRSAHLSQASRRRCSSSPSDLRGHPSGPVGSRGFVSDGNPILTGGSVYPADPGDGRGVRRDAAPVRHGYPADAADKPSEDRFGTVETAESGAMLTASGSGTRLGGICVKEMLIRAAPPTRRDPFNPFEQELDRTQVYEEHSRVTTIYDGGTAIRTLPSSYIFNKPYPRSTLRKPYR
ncbi:hypothetical protein DL771_002318 [Monosporascus sp. 5C6A]|nr:hypothetical protein DL771_002318 [Monosporascus sp. 5C6A]